MSHNWRQPMHWIVSLQKRLDDLWIGTERIDPMLLIITILIHHRRGYYLVNGICIVTNVVWLLSFGNTYCFGSDIVLVEFRHILL